MVIMRKVGKAAAYVLYILLIALAALALFSVISGRNSENGASLGPIGIFTVLSGSMSPTFDAGSVIVTMEAEPGVLEAGDIITYRPLGDETLVTHRIVEVVSNDEGYSYITRGDANNVNDTSPIPHENAVGRVIFYINGLGAILLFIRTPQGIAFVVIAVILLLLISYLIDTLKKSKSEERAKEVSREGKDSNNTGASRSETTAPRGDEGDEGDGGDAE